MSNFRYRLEGLRGRLIFARLMLAGGFNIFWLILRHFRRFRQLRLVAQEEEKYVRPPRRYELPAAPEGISAPRSNEKFLRPTRLCDCRAPLVAAVARELGAGHMPDYEYAEAAFRFVKNNMENEILPIDGVEETLRRGTGTCLQLISVFIALCRAGGVRARYKLFAMSLTQSFREEFINAVPMVRKLYDTMGYFFIEGEGEAYVDGRWIVAHIGISPERQAATGLPITRFGEDAIGLWTHAVPGTIMRLETLPFILGPGSRLVHDLAPASMERFNVIVQKQFAKGRRLLEEAGGAGNWDRAAREKWRPMTPGVDLRPREEISFVG